MKAKVIIDGQECDISSFEQLRLSITFTISHIKDIVTRRTSTSKTINLPRTKTNEKIFGLASQLAIDNALSQNSLTTARIETTSIILNGYAKLLSVTSKYFKIVIAGGSAEWMTLIRELNVNDLDFSEWDMVFNKTNILSANNVANVARSNKTYDVLTAFPFIDYGNYFYLTSYTKSVNEDFFPAFSCKMLLEKMINNQGYVINSAFVDNELGKYWIPFTNKKFRHSDDWVKDASFKVKNDTQRAIKTQYDLIGNKYQLVYFNESSYDDVFDNGNNFTTGLNSFYTVPENSLQRFKIKITLKFADDVEFEGVKILFGIAINSAIITSHEETLTIEGSGTQYQTFEFSNYNRKFNQGNTIQLYYKMIDSGGFTLNDYSYVYIETEMIEWSNIVDNRILTGSTMTVNDNLPDINQLDFISGIKQLFNLYFDTNIETRTVTIEPRDDFYGTKANAVDWSDKIDFSKEIELSQISGLPKFLKYSYKEDSNDKYVKTWNEEHTENLGTQKIELDNKFNKDTRDVVNPVFAPTIMGGAERFGIVNYKIPRLWNKDIAIPDKSTEFLPRILYFRGLRPLSNGEFWLYETELQPSLMLMRSYNESSIDEYNLLFSDTKTGYGLVSKHYNNTHNSFNTAKLLNISLYLQNKDLLALNFGQLIYLDLKGQGKGYFTLEEISDFSPLQKRSIKVTLLQVVRADDLRVHEFSFNAGDQILAHDILSETEDVLAQDDNGNVIIRSPSGEEITKFGEGLFQISGGDVLYEDRDGNYHNMYTTDDDGNIIKMFF